MEKKAKNFDKIVAEWKSKIDSLQVSFLSMVTLEYESVAIYEYLF